MAHGASGYDERAEQCGFFAASTEDVLLKRELLKLQETYRNIAACLRALSIETLEEEGERDRDE